MPLRFLVNAIVALTLVLVAGHAPMPAAAARLPIGCTATNGTLISGRVGDTVPAFIRVSAANGHRELLSMPPVQSGMIETQSLLPFSFDRSKPVTLSCTSAPDAVDANENVSLTGQSCDYHNTTVVDNGPRVIFEGAARGENGAAIRVQVVQEKFFGSGVFALDAWVGFRVDDGPQVALPAQGTEPVAVTAYFPNLSAGPHHVAMRVYEGFVDNDGAPQGVVCL